MVMRCQRRHRILLHPSVGDSVNESVVIQGHVIQFATVDLGAEAAESRRQLLGVLNAESLNCQTQ